MKIKIEAEFEIPQLREAYIYCPWCKVKFDAMENGRTEDGLRIHDEVDLKYAVFKCPNCKIQTVTRGEEIELIAR